MEYRQGERERNEMDGALSLHEFAVAHNQIQPRQNDKKSDAQHHWFEQTVEAPDSVLLVLRIDFFVVDRKSC